MDSLHVKISLAPFIFCIVPLGFSIWSITSREVGFWQGLKKALEILFYILFFLIVVFLLISWIFTDSVRILFRNMDHKDFAIDYIYPITFDAYRKFKIDNEIYMMCEKNKYSLACFSLANEYAIHDNRSRSEYYLKKIINNEMDECRLNGNISACENIIKAYKKLDDMDEVKEYKRLVDALKEQRSLSY